MNRPDRADVRRVNVRVNGITFESVWLRQESRLANDFDIVIDDPQIGRFALTASLPRSGTARRRLRLAAGVAGRIEEDSRG